MKCDRCGNYDFFCRELLSIYSKNELLNLCDECGRKADSFVKYYGKKKDSDLIKLSMYLVSGNNQVNKFNAMMNGGYHG
jgi:uncharacterized Zn finger protein